MHNFQNVVEMHLKTAKMSQNLFLQRGMNMPNELNTASLAKFSNINLGSDNSIVNITDDKNITKKKEFSSSNIFRWMRSSSTQAANNEARTQFLKSLGEAFDIDGMRKDAYGKITFSKEFMNKLEGLLGPSFKREDFGIPEEGGTVTSGKPLTQRRIKAIVNETMNYENKSFSVGAYKDKLNVIFKNLNIPDTTGLNVKQTRELFKDNPSLKLFTDMKKCLDYLENDADKMIRLDPEYEKALKNNDEKVLADFKDKTHLQYLDPNSGSYKPLTNLEELGTDVIWERLGGELIHTKRCGVNLTETKSADGVKKYIEATIKSFVKNGIDAYFESLMNDKIEDFNKHITQKPGACMEDKGKNFFEYRQDKIQGGVIRSLETKYETIIHHSNMETLKQRIENELNTLFTKYPDKDFQFYQEEMNKSLLGMEAQMGTLVRGKTGNLEFEPKVVKGIIEVRKITEEDIKNMLEPLYKDIVGID